jgi:2-oxopent-4-enoate/cis-2-oxohex-4-enoate hydratase
MSTPLPEGHYAELSDGMRMHYLDLPPATGAAKGNIILIQGSGPGASGWSNFQHNATAFANAGYRVLVIDLPGYGFTSKPQDAIYSLDYFVAYLKELADQLALNNCILVGNSLGGAIAIGFALAHPQQVSHLLLMAPGGLEEREVYFATDGIQAMVKYPLGSPEFTKDVLRELLKLLVFDAGLVTEQLVEERWQVLQLQNPQVLASMQVPNLSERLAELQCPVLGFWGTDDKFCPISGASTLINNCLDAQVNMLTKCGHWVMVEHTEYFNRQCLDFLQHTPAQQRPTMSAEMIEQLGQQLYNAMREGRTLPPFTGRHPNMQIADSYHISRAMLQLRLEGGQEVVVGKKIGVTSAAVQEMLGVFQPDFGFLTDRMAYANGAAIPMQGNLIQPRAEGEIAFRLKADLRGPGITEADVLAATDCIMPCFEIVDSRIDNWQIKIQDTIADNASCGVYVLGDSEIDPRGIDLAELVIKVFKNGDQISSGKGSAVQGNPLSAVAWLANTLGEFDIPLLAGEVILSGSLVPLEPVAAGDKIHLELTGKGIEPCSVNCSFVN